MGICANTMKRRGHFLKQGLLITRRIRVMLNKYLKCDKSIVSRHQLEETFRECNVKSPKDALDVLFGEHDYSTDYVIKYRWLPSVNTTIIQRFNCLWVYPLFFLTLAPIRFILLGHSGVYEDSTFGKILQSLVGELR